MKRFFKIKSSNGRAEYDLWLDTETDEWNCTCMFGTIGRWSEKNKSKLCRHAREFKICLDLAEKYNIK